MTAARAEMYQIMREGFLRLIKENGLEGEQVRVHAAPLSPEEAIGRPDEQDYPLLKGKERLMQADVKGAVGQAFTDMYGDFSGKLSDVAETEPRDNLSRAIFVSSLNALMRHLGLVEKSLHCREEKPRECALRLAEYIEHEHGQPRITFVGLQPRMVEALSERFELRVTDLDADNIGQERYGVRIEGPERTGANLEWCDMAIVTGTTIVNDTIAQFQISKPVVFYGVTISGAARLLGLDRFCPYGR